MIKVKNKKNIYIFAFLALMVLGFFCLQAKTVKAEDLEVVCKQISEAGNNCSNLSSTDCRATLEKCAKYYDEQSVKIAQDLTKTASEKKTLQSAITTLKNKVNSLETQIKQGTVMVKGLNLQIGDTKSSIDKTSEKIENSQNQIKEILRAVLVEDKKSSIEILLSGNLSDFFSNIAYLEKLNSKVSDLLDSTKNLKSYLEDQKQKMDGEVDQLQKTIKMQDLLKRESEQTKKEQEKTLKLTEAQYQQQLKDKQEAEKKSAAIKAKLFSVAGIAKVPTFGEALDIAKTVSNIVTIRPALLLAVISQESAIGKNVGKCLLTDSNTGVGKRISTGAVIPKLLKPTRDLQPFLSITSSLGRDPYNSILSCPITTGYDGGSMGPAQFLPSTWNMFAERLKNVLGAPADPWAIKDSFTASAMYLSDLGASAKTLDKEKNAAYRYNGTGTMARIYSNTVMKRAACIQSFIDNGTMTTECQNMIF